MTTRTFTADDLTALDLDWASNAPGLIMDVADMGSGRWYRYEQVVFKHADQLWQVDRQRPLTEIQENDPWSGEDVVTATLVEPYEAIVIKYRPVVDLDIETAPAVQP